MIAQRLTDVVFRGSFEEVQEYFHSNQWTDGLPIVPPTVEAVERFLALTSRPADEVLGVLGPANREATVLSVAVNGVMAGCRPDFMPILVAIVEAISDPSFRVQDAGSTPGWEPLIILSGPVTRDLDFNTGAGVLRIGRRANATVGRFLHLCMLNLAGVRIPPGDTDRATIGMSFFPALPEDEDVVSDLRWPTFGEDRGFLPGDSVVTVQSVVGVSMPTYSAGTAAEDHLRIISEVIGRSWCYWAFTGLHYGKFFPLLLLSPSIARAIASDGWSKDQVREYLTDHLWESCEVLERHAFAAGLTDFNIARLVETGRLPASYALTEDPDRMVRCIQDASSIGIVVSGDAYRNQSKGFVQNQEQGMPVSRLIETPVQPRGSLDLA